MAGSQLPRGFVIKHGPKQRSLIRMEHLVDPLCINYNETELFCTRPSDPGDETDDDRVEPQAPVRGARRLQF